MKKAERISKIKRKIEENLVREGNISLILESYEGLFSDFDPRPYSERVISDDFLVEVKRAVRDKEDYGLELRLLIPKEERNIKDETKIKERLKNYFQKHFTEKQKEIRKIRKEGILWVVIGALLMAATTAIKTYENSIGTLLANLLSIITEPAGWFSFWEGLGKIFQDAKEKKSEYEFYRKMAHVKISFQDY